MGFTFGAQAEIVPSSLAKMKRAGPESVPLSTTKSAPPANTIPVGALGGLPSEGGGTVTTSAFFTPAPS